MTINLEKGQRVGLGLQQAGIGLGWDPNDAGGTDFDLDASAFMLGENGKLISNEHFVFYNNPKSPDGSVTTTGDDRTGAGSTGDDETLNVDLTKVDPRVTEIYIVVTIEKYEERKQNFGQVRNSFVRIYDGGTKEEICIYELDEDFSIESAVEFGRLYRRGQEWKFEAVGKGYPGGLQFFLSKFS